jgi:transcriptional regulator with XRE-family HTH domain
MSPSYKSFCKRQQKDLASNPQIQKYAWRMNTLATRLTAAREAKQLSQTDLARIVGVSPQAIQAIEAGRVEKPRNILAIAKAVGVEPGALLTGDENYSLPREVVPLVGYVRAGATAAFYAPATDPLDWVDPIPGMTKDTVAVQIQGDSLGSIFDTWLVYYDEVRRPVTPDLHGKLCVVGLMDDRVVVKTIKKAKTPGLFNLLSNTDRENIYDVEIVWAARVKHMSPR